MAPTPLCKCRVLYIGSAVPTITKDGLQGIQVTYTAWSCLSSISSELLGASA